MEATLAERGQVVIPKAIRDQLGMKPGTLLTFTVEDGKLVVRKKVDDAISRVRGRFKFAAGDSLDEWMRDTRGRAPNDPIEPWEELRDDVEIPAAIREDHASRRAAWLKENDELLRRQQAQIATAMITPEKIASASAKLTATQVSDSRTKRASNARRAGHTKAAAK